VLGIAALFGGGRIAKRGSAALSEAQRDELKAMGPDPVAWLGHSLWLALAYLSRQYAWAMAAVVVVAMCAILWRVPFVSGERPGRSVRGAAWWLGTACWPVA